MVKTKLTKTQKYIPLTQVVAAGAFALAVVFALIAFHEKSRLDLFADQQMKDSMNLYQKSTRLEFCYNNDIKPCDDALISDWNKAHPDDTLNISAPQI
jgi:hypothetical protein